MVNTEIWLYSLKPKMEKLYTVSKNNTGSWPWLRSWTPSSKNTWTSPDSQHWNQIDYILCSQRWRSSTQSAKTRPGADCGSDREVLIPKFRLKLKKVGKATRPFRYDLNQIPYDYTMERTNRFKGKALIECLKNYGQRFVTLYRRWWSKPSPRKRNAKRQNGCLMRPYK